MEKLLAKKTIAILILMIFFTASSTSAVQVTITQAHPPHTQYDTPDTVEVMPSTNGLYCHLQINEKDLRIDTFLGYDMIEIKNYDISAEPGKPIVPMKTLRIALPPDKKATRIHLDDMVTQQLTGSYTLLLAQPPQKTNSIEKNNSFLPLYQEVSSSYHPYPSEPVQITGHCDLAGQAMVDIAFYPLIYLPSQHHVTLITSIRFTVELAEGYTCGDYLSKSLSDQGKEMYQQMVQRMVINPRQVTLRSAPHPQSKGVPPGNYEYVIITQESFVSAFEPLRDWKTKKGIPATIVTTTWIYNNGGYSGTNVEKIKAFVQDAQTTWGTMYFLLGGDTNTVPYSSRTFTGVDPDPVPNDTYYADYDNDWVCEVHVGRASVIAPGSGVGQIGNFINKTLTYERNPPLTDFAKKAALFGFDLDYETPAQQCKINIDNTYIPSNWTMTNVYDTHSGNHKTNVIAAINAGQNLMNHADHSNYDFMGTGYVNHDLGLENADMDALTNGNKQSIFYSMGCWPAAYDFSNSIAEHFVRDSNGGGIAFVGNSRYGWYNPGYVNTLSMKYDTYFFKSLFLENNYKLGACFSDHKNDAYQYDIYGYYKYIFTELTLLGDPELSIWKENPMNLTASHPSQIPLNTSSFTITVTSNSSPVNQAYVCLWKGTEIYERGLTNTAGTITLSITLNSTGTLHVTITKQNYLPFESTAQVIETNQPPYTPHTPSPPDLATTVNITEDLSWTGGDPNPGDTVTYDVYFGTTTPPPKIISNQTTTTYEPGTMNHQTTYYWRIIAWDNHSASTTGPLWQFTTTTINLPPVFGPPTPANGSTNNPIDLLWSIPINDPEGDLFSWTFACSNGQTNSQTGATNGTKSLWLHLAPATTYKIWVNATDPMGSGQYTRAWYTFTTEGSNPPVFGLPSPANSSTGNPLNFNWSIPIYDPEGDLFSWTIHCSNGQNNSGNEATNGTKTLTLSDMTYATTYTVWVNATDPSGSGQHTSAWYTFTTQQQENNPPNKPEQPAGETNGNTNIMYTYTTSTIDLDGDQVYYLWDWGDGTQSTWLGPYTSGATISTTHTWTKKGSYSIKVKAKDTFDAESDWSDPLSIQMPFSSTFSFQLFWERLFQRFPHAFPILRHLLGY